MGAAALGAAYLFFGTDGSPEDTAKEIGSAARGAAAAVEGKVGLRRGKEDYQKVYDRIAEELEVEGYDGEFRGRIMSPINHLSMASGYGSRFSMRGRGRRLA